MFIKLCQRLHLSLQVLLLLLLVEPCMSNPRLLSYDDIRKEGGFNSPTLKDVIEIFPGEVVLSETEAQNLMNSETLENLRTLDLTSQAVIDDDKIIQLANNPHFSKIMKLCLNGTNISDVSIEAILKSPNLGKVRDLPRISNKYDIPVTVISVHVMNTRVTNMNQREQFNFFIEYNPPNPIVTWEPDTDGVKILEIEAW